MWMYMDFVEFFPLCGETHVNMFMSKKPPASVTNSWRGCWSGWVASQVNCAMPRVNFQLHNSGGKVAFIFAILQLTSSHVQGINVSLWLQIRSTSLHENRPTWLMYVIRKKKPNSLDLGLLCLQYELHSCPVRWHWGCWQICVCCVCSSVCVRACVLVCLCSLVVEGGSCWAAGGEVMGRMKSRSKWLS